MTAGVDVIINSNDDCPITIYTDIRSTVQENVLLYSSGSHCYASYSIIYLQEQVFNSQVTKFYTEMFLSHRPFDSLDDVRCVKCF